ncbi:isocitrate lyase/PEP mutase family protein [Pararhodobacter oceanensis]|uniref:Carboxyvinyl-carboxyphosphonate phosphorylmutase n=1 Tax=Pararhodobacter oceanensis TaxID=2172121 RepID=A0A2T8HRP0_9RHOB|nr:isocitrate lyase/PEP mutase family protein [Pararhodobacter oceanensis]PVH28090.1 carboxyvinyl-carboxyphosphonate phosphorylmutase [Pararhodobacter oceanensis]
MPISLKQRLTQGPTLMAPGVYDGVSARLAAQAGFEALYMTGFGVSGASLGMPDIGLMSATEMAERARALAEAAAPLPLIADGDTGHGGVLNVARLVRLYEQAGVACIQLEDQVFPKRCGHMASKAVIGIEDAAAKIAAAVAARCSPEFLIMARTDARAPHGLDEALRRGEAFLQAGADILFIEAPQSLAELQRVAAHFKGVPLVANMVEDGKTPYLSAAELSEMGFALAIYPVSALLAVSSLLRDVYQQMQTAGRLPAEVPRLGFDAYNRAMGLGDLIPSALSDDT